MLSLTLSCMILPNSPRNGVPFPSAHLLRSSHFSPSAIDLLSLQSCFQIYNWLTYVSQLPGLASVGLGHIICEMWTISSNILRDIMRLNACLQFSLNFRTVRCLINPKYRYANSRLRYEKAVKYPAPPPHPTWSSVTFLSVLLIPCHLPEGCSVPFQPGFFPDFINAAHLQSMHRK